MKLLILALTLAATVAGYSQGTHPRPSPLPGTIDTLDNNYSFHIVQLDEPVYPISARQANIHGTVRLLIHLIGCQYERNSTQVVSGNAILAREALRSAQNSTIECDPANHKINSTGNLIYVFDLDRKCHDDRTTSRVMDNTVLVKACVAPPTP